ncbi:MAG: hypothetical protein R3C32_14985 [Chloroflexota bacterium]
MSTFTVNYRCPPEVVRRADRLVACVTERFIKRIDPAPNATGTPILARDPGDDLARARRLTTSWYGRSDGVRDLRAHQRGAGAVRGGRGRAAS